ncbi:hypothetical protein [Pseudotabrizicola alkalilacus]|uniref:Uncharacterized protein n=1 Tax=Pseudotabrizicola alkalilacus TaxID=2305252 RepID=A0A411Z6U6_9RHOB|nr:hypothetical protein [Pseudotabrizicola alkalilacus]RGP38779.1 hypothetical protein D1012_01245 [Pseudotabrizicola alkalilacus]
MPRDFGQTEKPDSSVRDDSQRQENPFCQSRPRYLLQSELAFERAVFKHPKLSIFRRNATTWEVLLMIARADEQQGPGLYEIVESVETNALGQSALLRFLRERREDGIIRFNRSPQKQSKWTLAISEDLRADLLDLLLLRQQAR